MTRPLKIQTETSPKSIKEMSNTEIEYSAHRLLVAFAANNSGVGTLSVNPGGAGSLTNIGTFTDTFRPYPVGAHPVGTEIVTVTYDFYQDLTNDNSDITTRPVQYTTGQGITTQSNSEIQSYIVSLAASRLIADGLGSYKLQNTSPTVGGTWTSIATITDTAQSGNTATYLWRRTTQTAPTTVRPLKEELLGNQHSLKEMSDADIDGLVPILRNYIVSSGIGQYRLQQSSPVSGTWVTSGDAFSDTRQQLGNVSYSGNYTGTFAPSYSGTYTSPGYTTNYTGNYTGSFSGSYSRSFAGTYAGSYRVFYAGYAGTLYTGNYTGNYTGSFSGSYSRSFAGTYTSPSYTTNYTGSYVASTYTGNYSSPLYSGNYVGYYAGTYTGSYSRSFAGTYAGTYQAFYAGTPGIQYTGNYTGNYTGSFSGNYTGNYAGTYTGQYATNYTGIYAAVTYNNTFSGNYTGQTVLVTKDTISTVSLWMRTA